MVDQRLLQYVKDRFAKGHSFQQIRESLLQRGWPEHHIIEAAHLAHRHHRRISLHKPMPREHTRIGVSQPSPKLLMILIAIVVVLAGVAAVYFLVFQGSGADTPLSSNDIYDAMLAAHDGVHSYTYDWSLRVPGEGDAAQVMVSGSLDSTSSAFSQRVDATDGINPTELISETYRVDGVTRRYLAVTDEWVEVPEADDIWSESDPLFRLTQGLRQAGFVDRLADEEIDGLAHYVLEIVPNNPVTVEFVQELEAAGELGTAAAFEPVSLGSLGSQSIKVYVSTENSILTRAITTTSYTLASGNETIDLEQTEVLDLQDVNAIVPIAMPEGALAVEETS